MGTTEHRVTFDDRTRVDESNKNTEPKTPPTIVCEGTTRTSGAELHDPNVISIVGHDSPLFDAIVEDVTVDSTDELNKQTDVNLPKAAPSCSNIIIPTHTNADAEDAQNVEDLCTDTTSTRFTVDED
eukprot:752809_1